MKIRTFGLKEANRMIPGMNAVFDDVDLSRKKISIIKSEMDWLREFWKGALHDSDNPDSERYCLLAEDVQNMHKAIQRKISEIEDIGCIVKDVESVLVDFYTVMNGELAFLCWKYGEKEILYWHPVDSGYRARQPIRAKKNKIR